MRVGVVAGDCGGSGPYRVDAEEPADIWVEVAGVQVVKPPTSCCAPVYPNGDDSPDPVSVSPNGLHLTVLVTEPLLSVT